MASRSKLIHGVAWSAIDVFGNQFLLLVISIVIARLLTPNDYGTVGIIIAFTQLVGKFMDCGINRGLYQAKTLDEQAIASAFVLFNVLALIGFLLLWCAAPWLAKYYDNPQLSSICKVMGICFGFGFLSNVPMALLSRELNFRLIGVANISSGIVAGIVAIGMAFLGYGVWALVAQRLLHAVVVTLMLWLFAKWRPHVAFSWGKLKPLFNFGIKIVFARLIEGGSWDFFNLLVGKTYSETQLGLYSKSRHLAQVPYSAVSSVVGRVFFQGMVAKQDDAEESRKLLKKSLLITNFCVTPLLIFLVVVSNDIILLLFGERWIAAIPYFQIMCIMHLGGVFLTFNQQSLSALGYSGNYLIATVISKALGLSLVFVLCHYDILYFMWGLVVMFAIDALIPGIIVGRICDYSIWKQLWDCLPVFCCALISCVIAWYIQSYLMKSIPLIFRLGCVTFIYGIGFLSLCYLLKIQAFQILLNLLPQSKLLHFLKNNATNG